MKREVITSLLVLSVLSVFAQDLGFQVKGAYDRRIRAEKFEKATNMRDLIDGYPETWIAEYVSTGITVVSGDKVNKAMGHDDHLTADQVSLLKSAGLGDDIVVDVAFKSKNFITNELDIRYMHYTATLVPEHEAEYPGGEESMKAYLKENAISKIPNESFKELQQAVFRFTVDEQGRIVNARAITTSGNPKTDSLLLKSIKNMPEWKPAENSGGIKVTQDFQLTVGNTGC
jgi:hypothetical protein